MTYFFRALIAISAILAMAAISASPASAGDPQIEAAQKQGIIGERIDGYLGIVSGTVEPSLQRKMNEINNKRRALYDRIARENGTTTEAVARVTGEKQIERAARGEYVMRADGVWTQK